MGPSKMCLLVDQSGFSLEEQGFAKADRSHLYEQLVQRLVWHRANAAAIYVLESEKENEGGIHDERP